MRLLQCQKYKSSLESIVAILPNDYCSFLITGASGLIGSCLIDALLYANSQHNHKHDIYALGRCMSKLENRFGESTNLHFIEQDICYPLDNSIKVDFIVHAASNADPISYSRYPAETISTNVLGTLNILHYCKMHLETRVVVSSTFEVYGESNKEIYSEDDMGEININAIRSGYPASKICSELLTRSYCAEYGVHAIIARFSSVYGPTMLPSDSKAHAQFFRNAINDENIVLKSKGIQYRTYTYVVDAVSGLLTSLFNGISGEAYNIANANSVVSIAELAQLIAEEAGTRVVYNLPNQIESNGFAKPHNCVLNNKKLINLGWTANYGIEKGVHDTIRILKAIKYS